MVELPLEPINDKNDNRIFSAIRARTQCTKCTTKDELAKQMLKTPRRLFLGWNFWGILLLRIEVVIAAKNMINQQVCVKLEELFI